MSKVRKRIFGIEDSLVIRPDLHWFDFSPNDEQALVNRNFISSIPYFISSQTELLETLELEPDKRIDLYYQLSCSIKNKRIRDVFRSQLFYSMLRSSVYFPDTLIEKVKEGISIEMESYVNRIEQKYRQFNRVVAPPIHLKDIDNNLVSLKNFRGNLVLLDFWFVGCSFCHEELPHTKKLIEAFRDKNFKVLHICMKSDREVWDKFQDHFVGIALHSNHNWDEKLTHSYKIEGFPRYVLINEDGIIIEGWCERPSDPALKKRIEDHFTSKGSQKK